MGYNSMRVCISLGLPLRPLARCHEEVPEGGVVSEWDILCIVAGYIVGAFVENRRIRKKLGNRWDYYMGKRS